MIHGESNEQIALIKWSRLVTRVYPDLAYLHCSLNGVKLTPIQARLAKGQGMLKGVLDLFLPCKRGQYSGIFIEMKYGKNTLTQPQQQFLEYVKSQGFATAVCYSWLEAKEILLNYLKG